jgi:hypothetical protein
LTNIRTSQAFIQWLETKTSVKLRLVVIAPECTIHGSDHEEFTLFKSFDSPVFYFSLTPNKLGRITIIVKLIQEDLVLGNTRIKPLVIRNPIGEVSLGLKSSRSIRISEDDFIENPDKSFLQPRCETGNPEDNFFIMDYPDIEQITDKPLRSEIIAALRLFSPDYVEDGLLKLSKLFETELKELLLNLQKQGRSSITSKDTNRLFDMINCVQKLGIIKETTYLTILRDNRNEMAHEKKKSPRDRRLLLRRAPFFGELYIKYIAMFHQTNQYSQAG